MIYDIHGNLPALEAVLDDAADAGADRWLLGGDYAAFGGWPAEVVDRLRSLDGAVWVRGNTDRWLADDSELPRDVPQVAALGAAREVLGSETVVWLAGLPDPVSLDGCCFCHASPLNDMESFGLEASPDEDRLLNGVTAPRVVFGHTHVQFSRVRGDGVELVNPGSVGIPLDGDTRAAYGLLGDDGVELRRVGYDVEAAVAGFRERWDNAPWTELFARRILTARF